MENQLSLFGFEPEQKTEKEEKSKTKVSKKQANADTVQSSDLFGNVESVDEAEKQAPILEDSTFSEEENDALSEIQQEIADTKEDDDFLAVEINEEIQPEESNITDEDLSLDNTVDTPIEHSFFEEENDAIPENQQEIVETKAAQDFLAAEINEQIKHKESDDIHEDFSFSNILEAPIENANSIFKEESSTQNEFQQESAEIKAEQEFLDAEINEQIQPEETNNIEEDLPLSDAVEEPIEDVNSFFEEENKVRAETSETQVFDTENVQDESSSKDNIEKQESTTPAFLSKTFEVSKKGRKSFKEIDAELDLIQIPSDEMLFSKQYYPISQVAKWFRVNNSLLRFWENEFDILKPRKNRKGDRLFRPEDIKNLQIIYYLLRQKKYTIAGAKKYIKNNKKTVDVNMKIIQTLNDFKTFLLELKANADR